MATLRPTKTEIQAVAATLAAGAGSPEEMAEAVIQQVEMLRYERTQWISVFELSPGIYQGYGPYPTRAAAEKGIAKIPMAQVAKRGAMVPVLGPAVAEAGIDKADEPVHERTDFVLVREDAAAFRKGWRGKLADRHNYV